MKTLKFEDKATLSKVKAKIKVNDGAMIDGVKAIWKAFNEFRDKVKSSQMISTKNKGALIAAFGDVRRGLEKIESISKKLEKGDD